MAISKQQPMREGLIAVLDTVNIQADSIATLVQSNNALANNLSIAQDDIADLENNLSTAQQDITTLESDLEDANTVIGQLREELQIVSEDLASVPTFEYGASTDNTVTANTSIGVDIVFTEAKQSAPYVYIAIESDENNEYIANCLGIVSAVSATGFSVRLYNNAAVDANITINWLAIGE